MFVPHPVHDDDLHHHLRQRVLLCKATFGYEGGGAFPASFLLAPRGSAAGSFARIKGRARGKVWRAAIRFDRLPPAPASRTHASRSHSHLAPQPPDTPVTPWKGQRIYTVTRPDLWKAQSAHELDRILMDSVFMCA